MLAWTDTTVENFRAASLANYAQEFAASRRPDDDAMVSDDATVATPSALYRAYVYAVYHLLERPVKRVARKIAHSGYWGY
jgi:hypothetical protein